MVYAVSIEVDSNIFICVVFYGHIFSSVYQTLCAANPNHFKCQNIHGTLRVVVLAGLGGAGAIIILLLIAIFCITRKNSNPPEKKR